jgi:DNA polymerase III psi subunit
MKTQQEIQAELEAIKLELTHTLSLDYDDIQSLRSKQEVLEWILGV